MLSNGGTYYLEYLKITAVTSIPPCKADYSQDKLIDAEDLSIFAEYFGRGDCIGDCQGDFTADGDVDGKDMVAFMEEFGRNNCP